MYDKKSYLKRLRRPYKYTKKKRRSSQVRIVKSKVRRLNSHTFKSGDYVQSKYQFRQKIKSIVNVPETYMYSNDLKTISRNLSQLNNFVMKPNHLSRGIGIRVLEKKKNNKFHDINGDILTKKDLIDECAVIMRVTRGKGIKAIIFEEWIHRHPYFSKLCTGPGMPDIRCIYYKDMFLFGVGRFPSKSSQGYGNIIRGANFGFFDISGSFNNDPKFQTSTITNGKLPFHSELITTGQRVTKKFGYAFMGIDMTVDKSGKVYVIEAESLPQIEYYLTKHGAFWLMNIIQKDLKELPRSRKKGKKRKHWGNRGNSRLSSYFPVNVPKSK